MHDALALIRAGWPATLAAQSTGIHRVTIYKNAEYKALRRARMRALLDIPPAA